jgi:carbonic anhydrase
MRRSRGLGDAYKRQTRAIERNARHVADQLTARSALLQDAVAAGRLTIRSAYCDIGSGVVTLL